MDINTVTEIVRRPADPVGTSWRPGDAWLAGGTWLFSDRQPELRRLVDLGPLGWDAVTVTDTGLQIGPMCTIADLYTFAAPTDWHAAPLIRIACEAFLASFKVWNSATVGGNICMSLPAGPMITLTVALEGTYTLQSTDGTRREVEAADFVSGNQRNILGDGEVLRAVQLPVEALHKRQTHRRFSLTRLGRSTIFMIATQSLERNDMVLTLTAATTRPVRLRFDRLPQPDELRHAIDDLPDGVWFADPNGTPDHRRHLARYYAEDMRAELSIGSTP